MLPQSPGVVDCSTAALRLRVKRGESGGSGKIDAEPFQKLARGQAFGEQHAVDPERADRVHAICGALAHYLPDALGVSGMAGTVQRSHRGESVAKNVVDGTKGLFSSVDMHQGNSERIEAAAAANIS